MPSSVELKKRDAFNLAITEKYGSGMIEVMPTKDEHPLGDLDNGKEEPYPSLIPDNEHPIDISGKVLNQQPAYDKLIEAQVQLPQRGEMKRATVKGRSVTSEGETTGTFDDNPYLNSIVYDVEFPDREVKQYSAYLLAENMYSQVDADGHSMNLL